MTVLLCFDLFCRVASLDSTCLICSVQWDIVYILWGENSMHAGDELCEDIDRMIEEMDR
jgi:hypothetical protein